MTPNEIAERPGAWRVYSGACRRRVDVAGVLNYGHVVAHPNL